MTSSSALLHREHSDATKAAEGKKRRTQNSPLGSIMYSCGLPSLLRSTIVSDPSVEMGESHPARMALRPNGRTDE